MLTYICYKEYRYVAVCQFIPRHSLDQTGSHTHTHTDGMNWHTAAYWLSL